MRRYYRCALEDLRRDHYVARIRIVTAEGPRRRSAPCCSRSCAMILPSMAITADVDDFALARHERLNRSTERHRSDRVLIKRMS